MQQHINDMATDLNSLVNLTLKVSLRITDLILDNKQLRADLAALRMKLMDFTGEDASLLAN